MDETMNNQTNEMNEAAVTETPKKGHGIGLVLLGAAGAAAAYGIAKLIKKNSKSHVDFEVDGDGAHQVDAPIDDSPETPAE